MPAMIRQGSRGNTVHDLQHKLAAAGFDPGPKDGIFGPKTRAAVIRYQRARNLQVDGIVGPETWGSLLGSGGGGGGGGGGRSAPSRSTILKQVPAPDDAEIWNVQGKWYVKYDVPKIKAPLVYHIEDQQQLRAIFGPGVQPRADRTLSRSQFRRTGAIPSGGSTELANLSDHPFQSFMSNYKRMSKVQPWLKDKEVLSVVFGAILEGRRPTRSELQSTKWFRSRNKNQRAWMSLWASDPKTAKRVRSDNFRKVRDGLIEAGVSRPPGWLVRSLANPFTRGDITRDHLEDQIRQVSDPFAPGRLSKIIRNELGRKNVRRLRNLDKTSEGEDRVRNLARMWLGPRHGNMNDNQVRRWAGKIRNDPDAEQQLVSNLRSQLSRLYDVDDPNLTWDDLAQPWVNMASTEWGQNVDPEDRIIERLIKTNDSEEGGKLLRKIGLQRQNKTVQDNALSEMGQSFDLNVRRML